MKEYRKFTAKESTWIKEFEKVMKKAPNTLFLFVGSGISVFTKDENNERYMNGDSVDSQANHVGITTKMEYDGGDY